MAAAAILINQLTAISPSLLNIFVPSFTQGLKMAYEMKYSNI